MKAKDWAQKFLTVGIDNKELTCEDFAKETAELIAERTKNSHPLTVNAATEGALREQRQKWRAICKSVLWLRETAFDEIVAAFLPEVFKSQNTWTNEHEKNMAESSRLTGREIANSLPGSKE